MSKPRIGIQLHNQAVALAEINRAAQEIDGLGLDTLYNWDHFFPLYGDMNATHFECYTMLAAWALLTKHIEIGAMVTCNSYRNPNMLADMARTIDHLSGGRFILAIGAGWFEKEYIDYGYTFGTAATRLAALARDLPLIEARLARLNPPPLRKMPILIGGGGEKVTLKLTAQHATIWNFIGTVDEYKRKNAVLNDWCAQLGRDPAGIERSVLLETKHGERDWDAYLQAGATHIIVGMAAPFDMDLARRLVAWRG